MADYVFVATGAPAALASADRLVGTMGAIVIVGMPATGVMSGTFGSDELGGPSEPRSPRLLVEHLPFQALPIPDQQPETFVEAPDGLLPPLEGLPQRRPIRLRPCERPSRPIPFPEQLPEPGTGGVELPPEPGPQGPQLALQRLERPCLAGDLRGQGVPGSLQARQLRSQGSSVFLCAPPQERHDRQSPRQEQARHQRASHASPIPMQPTAVAVRRASTTRVAPARKVSLTRASIPPTSAMARQTPRQKTTRHPMASQGGPIRVMGRSASAGAELATPCTMPTRVGVWTCQWLSRA